MDVEASVHERYAAASRSVQPALCCPVQYAGDYLAVIPEEILERDYGCGDPSPYVQPGETVLDLGCGGGKLCYILAQVVGPAGRVIGVDCNAEMLALARRHQATVAQRLGYANVEFRRGLIQDLGLDLELLQRELEQHPIRSIEGWLAVRSVEDRLRRTAPLVWDESIDCVVSNCVLNLVRPRDRHALFAEMHRVLKAGGRAAVSDIVADQDVPEALQRDPELWSGCLSGAYREDRFLEAFEQAGFYGVELVRRQSEPWRVVEGIEFRSVTVVAYKGGAESDGELRQTIIYRGPFRRVEDDRGQVFPRGRRVEVDAASFQRLQRPPYAGMFHEANGRAGSGDALPLAGGSTGDCCGGRC